MCSSFQCICTHNCAVTSDSHENDFFDPAAALRALHASFDFLLAAANFGSAFCLFACLFFFFSASVGLSGILRIAFFGPISPDDGLLCNVQVCNE